jgi:hypothetical protein
MQLKHSSASKARTPVQTVHQDTLHHAVRILNSDPQEEVDAMTDCEALYPEDAQLTVP